MILPPLEVFKLEPGAKQALLEIVSNSDYIEPLKRVKAIFDNEQPEKYEDLPWQGDELGRLMFVAAVLDYPDAVERYKKLGWPISFLNESLVDIGIWTKNRFRNFGDWGLERNAAMFIRASLRGNVARAGRLQFNTNFVYSGAPLRNSDGDILLMNGDAAINLHIPEDGPLDIDLCLNSMKKIKEFYHNYLPEVNWRGFVCHSWFLDPKLQEFLPKESNIVKFQKLGFLIPLSEKSDVVYRVFGARAKQEGVTAVEWKTSLQKLLGPYLRDGGEIYATWLFIPR